MSDLKAVLDAALDCVVMMDHEGRIVGINPAAERAFGISDDEARGREMAEVLIPPTMRGAHRHGLARLVAGGEPQILDRRIEVTAQRADGTLVPVELTITRAAVDGPPLFVGDPRDIGDRIEAEEALRRSRLQLLRATDEARRRLERDLHDGAQQRLVGLALTLRLARGQLESDPAAAVELLDEAQEDLASATDEHHWTGRGLDSVEFFLSANLGEEPRPLARIVSGGELSRVMLALKTLAAVAADPTSAQKTLIFDEVDAGIGGRVATVVGQKLALLGERYQVLCITHLPQVAACGRTQFLIQKQTRGRRTVTSVQKLSRSERVEELARMMGGADAGERARSGAQELLDAAQAKGENRAKAKGESLRERKRT